MITPYQALRRLLSARQDLRLLTVAIGVGVAVTALAALACRFP